MPGVRDDLQQHAAEVQLHAVTVGRPAARPTRAAGRGLTPLAVDRRSRYPPEP